jgi:hypothetical protein
MTFATISFQLPSNQLCDWISGCPEQYAQLGKRLPTDHDHFLDYNINFLHIPNQLIKITIFSMCFEEEQTLNSRYFVSSL